MVLRGPRQVGKTTLVNQLGALFDNYLYNLEIATDRNLLEMDIPLRQLLVLMFARKGQRQKEGKTLVFLDEIQCSPVSISKLRYFYEDMPEVHVIAAGSLLENIVDVNVSFPVGRVDFLPVRPCSFKEFLGAMGKESQIEIMHYPKLTQTFHDEYMAFFHQYCVVGGMPEAVQQFVDSEDMLSVDTIYSRLLRGYMDDVEKYAKKSRITEVVRHVIRYGWGYAGSLVTLGGFANSDYRSRDIDEAFALLQKAMLLELVYPCTSVRLPIIPELRRSPKLFWVDTGMVNYVAQVRRAVIGANDILDVWKGRIGEHVVAQELLTLTTDINRQRSFWTRGKGSGGAEVDLTWVVDSQLIPIEVKNGHNSHLRSLHSFLDESPTDIAVRVWAGPYSVNDLKTISGGKHFRLYNIPFYLVGELENIVRQ